MVPRYIVRRAQGDQRYAIWDNGNKKVARDGERECSNLSFEEAFNMADNLNAEDAKIQSEALLTREPLLGSVAI